MLLRVVTLLAVVSWSAATQVSAQDPFRPGPSFVDRFDRLDKSRWLVSDGWSNGAYQNCTWLRANVKIGPFAALSLDDRANSLRKFACAELQTMSFYSYGAYEVRLRAVAGPGIVTAFFTYTGGPHAPGRPHDEIDFEFLGKSRRGVDLNYFLAGKTHAKAVALDFDATAEMNNYAFVWLPDSIRWFANGKLIREVRKSDGVEIPAQSQKLYISLWTGTGSDQEAWLGTFRYAGTPLVATYEYVAFTKMHDACQFPESIVCSNPDLFAR
jgi:endo-1,3-1,4-beta-glycanase ExoK